jgi:hypothetical protein
MKKRELAPIELKEVVELRQLGAKWTEIEQEAKVERRAAKRAYEEWEKDKQIQEQQAVRFRVAAEAFHEHLNDLVKLAESLIDVLQVPKTLRELGAVEEDLDQLWIRYLEAKHEPFPASSVEEERVIRRNRLLLESLQSHTREKVRWEALEEWKQSWNNAAQYSQKLRSKATEITRNNLSNCRGLEKRIKTATGDKNAVDKIAGGVIEHIWRGILTGKPDHMHVVKGASLFTEGQVWLTFYESDSETRFYLNDEELAKKVWNLCNRVVTSLREGVESDLVQKLTGEVSKMQARTKELEESLDGLVLRPMILRTRCDLCPM